jgi:hypothetical protein
MRRTRNVLTQATSLFVILINLFISAIPVASAAPPVDEPDRFRIELQSRQFVPQPGIRPETEEALASRGEDALAQDREKIHTILQLDDIPTLEEREWLRRQGIELLTYIPNYAWLAAIPAADPARVVDVPGVRWVGDLTVQDKLQAELYARELGAWSYDPETGSVALLVQFYRDVDLDRGSALVQAHGGEVIDRVPSINTLLVYLAEDEIVALAAEDAVEWIEEPLPVLEPINDANRARVGADTLQNVPYSLDGTDVDVLVYDGGRVYAHNDLDGKRTWGDTASFSEHATHVACTILGDGTNNWMYRGMAPNAELLSMGFQYDGTGVFLYTNPGDVEADLQYAKTTWAPSADVFNASIGTNTAPNGFRCSLEGNYGATSQLVDAIVSGSLGEPFIAAWANGNERGSGRCGTGYYTTAPPACAKNPIHSGATDSIDDTMSTFSSWGPCDDGRLKPTISSPGVDVMSCNDVNDYENKSGTSMASPTTAGVIALMLEQYRATYTTSGEFLPSTAKALLMHTAVDLGNAGPDYQFGYGRIDGVGAVDAIVAGDFREELMATHGQVDEYTIAISGTGEFRVSLAWDDPPGSLAALKKLVNDLDLEVQAPDGTTYYPWALDPDHPDAPASPGVDELNNQEQVIVNSPMNGVWTVRVKATILPEAPQAYSLVFSGAAAAAKTSTPGGPPTPPPTSCSESIANGGFEGGSSPWMWNGSATSSSAYAHGGTYSGAVGGTVDGTFYQELSLPADFYTGTLTYWIRMETDDGLGYADWFEAELRDQSDNVLTTLQVLHDGNPSYQGVWRQEIFALTSQYAGQTVRLAFDADVDSSLATHWYVDDVSLNACRATGGNTPPVILDLPDLAVAINGSLNDAIDLWAYAEDGQDPDTDLAFTIDNAPDPDAGVSIDANRYVDVNPTPGWSGETLVLIRVTDTGGLSDIGTFWVTVQGIAAFPFCDGFESGSLGDVWTTYTTDEGRVQVSPSYPYSGTYSVLLDDAISVGAYSYAAIILTIDLSGQSSAYLDFWWREFGDEDHVDDGVFLSDDWGGTWVTAMNFAGNQFTFASERLDLVTTAAANGLTLNDHFQIKFQYYDNYPIPSDGYAIDEVCVWSPPQPDIDVAPAFFEETLLLDETVTRTLTISNEGSAALTFRIDERAGGFSSLWVPTAPTGGNNSGQIVSSRVLGSYPLAIGDFTSRAASPDPLTCVTVDPGTGYVYAQENSGTQFYRYDPRADSWTALSSCPLNSGNNGGAAYLGGRIYTVYTGNGAQLGVYDVGSDTWSTMSNGLGTGSGNITSDGEYLYLVAGTTFRRYDPGSDTWSSLATPGISFQRWGGLAHLNGVIYGHQGDGYTGFSKYDIASDTWTMLSAAPGGVVLGSAIDPSGEVYYAYGSYGGSNWYAFDLASETWSLATNPLFTVYDGGMAYVGQGGVSGIYFVEGENGTGLGRFETAPHSFDVPWLSADPVTGTVPAHSALSIDVRLDASQVGQPGVYSADLIVYNNDPYASKVSVPVTMTVLPLATMGKLLGTVTSNRLGGPLQDALVEVFSGTTSVVSDTTGASGSYGPWWFQEGDYTVAVSADGYVTDTQPVAIVAQQTVTHDVTLILDAPGIEFAPASFEETVMQEDAVTKTLLITNTGNQPLDFEIWEVDTSPTTGLELGPATLNTLRTDDEIAPSSRPVLSTLDIGDALFQVDATASTGHTALLGVEYALDSYWVTSGGLTGSADPNYLFQLDRDGNVLNSWAQPTVSTWGWRDLAFDGTYLYASDSAVVEQIDPATGLPTGVTIACPTNLCRALAYDPATDHFWTADFSSDIWEFDRSGAIVNTYANTLAIYGMAWDSWSSGGPYLWVWSQDGDPAVLATQIDPSTGTPTGVSFSGAALLGSNIAGGASISPDLVVGKLVFVGMHQASSDTIVGYDMDVFLFDDVPWLSQDPVSGTIAVGNSLAVDVTLDATGMSVGDYTANMVILHNDPYRDASIVSVTMHVISATQPVSPVLLLPANGSSTCDDTPTFTWGSVSGATSYRIQVDDDPAFGSPEVEETTASTSYTPASGLAVDTYYWHVLASNAYGESPWSGNWTFALEMCVYLPIVLRE